MLFTIFNLSVEIKNYLGLWGGTIYRIYVAFYCI